METLAQITYSTTTSSNVDTAAAAAFAGTIFFITFLFVVATYVIYAICLMRIFAKAGEPGWAAWVPVYNGWKVLELGGQQGFWAVLALIPGVSIVSAIFTIIAQYHIGLKLGKGGAFVLLAIFFPIIWVIWLAFDKSQWNGSGAPAAPVYETPAAPAAAPMAAVPPAPTDQPTQDNQPTPPTV